MGWAALICGGGAGALQSLQPAVRVRGLGVEMMMPARCSRCSRLSASGEENSGRCWRRLVAVVERIVGVEGVLSGLWIFCAPLTFLFSFLKLLHASEILRLKKLACAPNRDFGQKALILAKNGQNRKEKLPAGAKSELSCAAEAKSSLELCVRCLLPQISTRRFQKRSFWLPKIGALPQKIKKCPLFSIFGAFLTVFRVSCHHIGLPSTF